MKIDFTKLEVSVSFDGKTRTFNVAQSLGNMMMYNSTILLDIGFEDLAKSIYYSEGEIEIPDKYKAAIIEVVKQSSFIAAVKRELIKLLQ